MGLLILILTLMARVGFTETVRGTPATMFHGVPDSWECVSNMSIVIHGYSHDFTDFKPLPQWDSMAIPIPLRLESRWK